MYFKLVQAVQKFHFSNMTFRDALSHQLPTPNKSLAIWVLDVAKESRVVSIFHKLNLLNCIVPRNLFGVKRFRSQFKTSLALGEI